MTLRIGALWMLLNLAAAAFFGAEFVVQEVRSVIRRRHDREAAVPASPLASHRASARRA